MTYSEKIEQFIEVAPPHVAEELRFWVKMQREAGWGYETIYQKMVNAFRKVAAELEK